MRYGALALVALLTASPALAQSPTGKQLFAQKCGVCHYDPGLADAQVRLGPSLKGVVGRRAGSSPTFTRYSSAMKSFGKTWDAATLSAFLAAPQKTVAGTAMSFPGLPDPEQRQALIAYLTASR
jgi:cytochrome c